MRDLQSLIPFVQSVKSGSFAAAAVQLQLTPAAISKSIARLEREYGVRLFNRTTRQIRLTVEGEAFYDRVSALLAGIDEAVDNLKSAGREPKGLVRVSLTASFGRHCVLPLLRPFLDRYPDIELDVSFDEILPSLVEGGFDVRIQQTRNRETSHVARLLCDYPVILVATDDYLRRKSVPMHPSDLLEHDCVNIRSAAGKAVWRLTRRMKDRLPFDGPTYIHRPVGSLTVATQFDASLEACLMGNGITASSLPIVLPYLKRKALRVVLPDYRILEKNGKYSQIFIQFPHRHHLSVKVRSFVDFMIEHFQDQSYAIIDLAPYACEQESRPTEEVKGEVKTALLPL